MQSRKAGMQSKEKLSLGSLLVTIVLANVLVLIYAAPYA
jgi:hypothetical protein